MPETITGEFDVTMKPLATDVQGLGRFSLDKTYRGDLEAESKGEMLTAMGAVSGSAGYVAIERVTGSVKGSKGSFVLQHSGSMNRGDSQLSLTVVPDSGTGELASLSGSMHIRVESGKHFYDFTYSFNVTAAG